jgi:hypothetical protein
MNRISTGNEALDAFLDGGFPHRGIVLIEGIDELDLRILLRNTRASVVARYDPRSHVDQYQYWAFCSGAGYVLYSTDPFPRGIRQLASVHLFLKGHLVQVVKDMTLPRCGQGVDLRMSVGEVEKMCYELDHPEIDSGEV